MVVVVVAIVVGVAIASVGIVEYCYWLVLLVVE